MEDREFLRDTMIRTRIMLQAVFVVLFVLSAVLTYYYIRLGIVGILVSVYAFSEAISSITGKIPGFWKRRMYWEKGAIIFIIAHTLLYVLVLERYEDVIGRRAVEFGPLLVFIELPLLFLGFFGPHMSKVQYYAIFLWGTMAYVVIGALLGIVSEIIIYFSKIILKRRKINV